MARFGYVAITSISINNNSHNNNNTKEKNHNDSDDGNNSKGFPQPNPAAGVVSGLWMFGYFSSICSKQV